MQLQHRQIQAMIAASLADFSSIWSQNLLVSFGAFRVCFFHWETCVEKWVKLNWLKWVFFLLKSVKVGFFFLLKLVTWDEKLGFTNEKNRTSVLNRTKKKIEWPLPKIVYGGLVWHIQLIFRIETCTTSLCKPQIQTVVTAYYSVTKEDMTNYFDILV